MPAKFSNAHYYRIAGRYTFAGDLFIVRETIYFFPDVDLSEQRSDVPEVLPDTWALLFSALVSLAQKASVYTSGTVDLASKGTSDEQFRETADAQIAQLRQRKRQALSQSLPLPTRVTANEISEMRLSATGRLTFSAQSDTHDFNVGIIRRRRLRDALSEMGIGQV